MTPLGNGGGGEAIAYNPTDGLLYHLSGSGDNQIFESVGLVEPFTVTDIPMSSKFGSAMSMTYWPSENVFLANGGNALYRIAPNGMVTLVGWNGRHFKGFAFATVSVPDFSMDLMVSMTGNPDPVYVGDDLTYRVQVTNRGSEDATGVTLTHTLPSGVTFVEASSSCVHASGIVTCNLGTLKGGKGTALEVKVKPTNPGMLTSSVSVQANETESIAFNNTASVTTLASGKAGILAGELFRKGGTGWDTISVTLDQCTNLGAAVQDLWTRTVHIEVGSFSADIPGSAFVRKGGKYMSKNQNRGSMSYILIPDKGQIEIWGKDLDLTGTENPIHIFVRIGDWAYGSDAMWKETESKFGIKYKANKIAP